jgi:hypothetical protein
MVFVVLASGSLPHRLVIMIIYPFGNLICVPVAISIVIHHQLVSQRTAC